MGLECSIAVFFPQILGCTELQDEQHYAPLTVLNYVLLDNDGPVHIKDRPSFYKQDS